MQLNGFIVTPPPHLHSGDTVQKAMLDVLIGTIPVLAVSLYFFKWVAVVMVLICVSTAILTELLANTIRGKPLLSRDLSSTVTGVLLALCLPATFPWWLAVIATVMAIGVAKELMGGLGWNLFNPALFGRISVIVLAPALVKLNADLAPLKLRMAGLDVISGATPMALVKLGTEEVPGSLSLFLGFPGGSLAETSSLAILIGGLWLIYRQVIDWRTPVSILATVMILTSALGSNPFFHFVAGGLMLGSFFMATDWVTSPITDTGKVIFGICIGTLIVLFRLYQAMPEGVAFSIIIINVFVPLIDRLTRRAKFGEVPVSKATRAISGLGETGKTAVVK